MTIPFPIKPMEPITFAEPFDSLEYLFQVKWDGVRCLAYTLETGTRLFNRKLNERTRQYPEIVESLDKLPRGIILDGEIITLGQDMKPNFRRVLKRDLAKNSMKISQLIERIPVYYMVFDIVYYANKNIADRPLTQRQEILEKVLCQNPIVKAVDSVLYKGVSLFNAVKNEKLEGIIAKRLDGPYIFGEKTSYWRKIKVWQELIAVIGGYSTKMGEIRSLLVGLFNQSDNLLYYIGNASSGVSHNQWLVLQQHFERCTDKPVKTPFVNPPRKPRGEEYHWVKPELCLKLEYTEWTEDFRLRNPKVIDFANQGDGSSGWFFKNK
ncbi:MAG: DNA ligase [Clostridia bacterium]|nr:DNA ligase [Clostridia bacterium]